MLIGDFWCGTKSATQAFADKEDEIVSIDIMPSFQPTICKDILDVTVDELREFGEFDFIWASPDCSVFSIANLKQRHFGLPNTRPLTDKARGMVERVQHTRDLLEALNPKHGFLIENPRGLLRKLPVMQGLPRRTVTYCSYFDGRMKPTDLWGPTPPTWVHRPPCHNENPLCHHERSARGQDSGTMALDWEDRIKVPYELSYSLWRACSTAHDRDSWRTLEKWT